MAHSLDRRLGQHRQGNNEEYLCVMFAHQLDTSWGLTEEPSGQGQAEAHIPKSEVFGI